MKILISGASGFVGKYLYNHLCREGFSCYKLVRNNPRRDNEIYWDPYNEILDLKLIDDIDFFIHLSGANIADALWTKKRKQILYDSRIKTTKFLSDSIVKLNDISKKLFVASATGYYGSITNGLVTESNPKGKGFLSSLCEDWENSAQLAVSSGLKTVFMRFGIVMGKDGGFLEKLLKIYRLYLGGIAGDKNAHLSWIAIEDLCKAVVFLINQNHSNGPYNFVSPNPITQKELCAILSQVVKRPAFLNIHPFIIKIFFGEMGKELFLTDQKIYPEKLLKEGFNFSFPFFEKYINYLFK